MKTSTEFLLQYLLLPALNAKKGSTCMRLVLHLTAFSLLIAGYFLGCKVLYEYVKQTYSDLYASLAICSVWITTSCFLFFINWLTKPKSSINTMTSMVEKTLEEIPNYETLKKTLSKVGPKAALVAFGIGILASYFSHSKKEI